MDGHELECSDKKPFERGPDYDIRVSMIPLFPTEPVGSVIQNFETHLNYAFKPLSGRLFNSMKGTNALG